MFDPPKWVQVPSNFHPRLKPKTHMFWPLPETISSNGPPTKTDTLDTSIRQSQKITRIPTIVVQLWKWWRGLGFDISLGEISTHLQLGKRGPSCTVRHCKIGGFPFFCWGIGVLRLQAQGSIFAQKSLHFCIGWFPPANGSHLMILSPPRCELLVFGQVLHTRWAISPVLKWRDMGPL